MNFSLESPDLSAASFSTQHTRSLSQRLNLKHQPQSQQSRFKNADVSAKRLPDKAV